MSSPSAPTRGRAPLDFEERLAGYRRLAPRADTKGPTKRPNRARQLGSYATAAGSALALAGSVEAAVIYSGAQGYGISVTPAENDGGFANTSIDLDGASGPDLFLGVQFSNFISSSSSSRFTSGWAGVSFSQTSSGAVNQRVIVNTFNSAVRRLSSGETIGPSARFNLVGAPGGSSLYFNRGSGSYPSGYGQFAGNSSGIIGVEFVRGGNTHYAWVRVGMQDQPLVPPGYYDNISNDLFVIDWAWEDQPNTPIVAGVPEPSGLSMLAGGAMSLVAWRKRRARAKAEAAATAEAGEPDA